MELGITNGILGAKGSGKSVLLAHFMNEYNGKSVLFDVLGVYNPKNNYKTAIIPYSYYCVSPAAFLSQFSRFPKNAKIVIDFSNVSPSDLINQVDKVCEKILTSKTKIAVFSDEVADFMPNNGAISEMFHKVVKNGRNYGIKPVTIATQRPQSTSKSIFDLCECFLISTQRAPRTIDYVLEILDKRGDKETGTKIRQLQKREFLFYNGVETGIYKVPEYSFAFKQ